MNAHKNTDTGADQWNPKIPTIRMIDTWRSQSRLRIARKVGGHTWHVDDIIHRVWGIHPGPLYFFVWGKKATARDTHFMWHALQRAQLAAVSAEIELRERSADLLLSAYEINHSVGLQERRHVCTMTLVSSLRIVFPHLYCDKSRLLPYDWLVVLTDKRFAEWDWSWEIELANPSTQLLYLTQHRLLLAVEWERKNWRCFVLYVYTELPFYQCVLCPLVCPPASISPDTRC